MTLTPLELSKRYHVNHSRNSMNVGLFRPDGTPLVFAVLPEAVGLREAREFLSRIQMIVLCDAVLVLGEPEEREGG